MDILEALKPTGKANYDKEFAYAMLKGDDLFWYKSSDDTAGAICHVGFQDILRDDWQPYHEKPEIRPEKAGELWRSTHGCFAHTQEINGCLYFTMFDSRVPAKNKDVSNWTRLRPSVPDENVEEVVIEDVRDWRLKYCNSSDREYTVNLPNGYVNDLEGKPPMKMTLKWKKEK